MSEARPGRYVVALGDANVDLAVELPAESGNRRQPAPPDLRLGGTVANTAVALARLGVPVSFVGAVGDDGYGRFVTAQLAAAGVDVASVGVDRAAFTTLVLAIVDARGERTLFGWPRRGGAHTRLRPEQVDAELIRRAAYFHASGMCLVESPVREAVLEAMVAARAAGVPVSLDLNLRIGFRDGRFEPGFLETIERAIGVADVVLGSATDELAYLGPTWRDAARRIAGERTVVARLGAGGAVAFTGDEVVEAPGRAVAVVSTLGAGDAFDAGFVAARVEGRGLAEALRMGNAVAALQVAGREITRDGR